MQSKNIVTEDIIVTLYTCQGVLFQSSFSLVLWTESPFVAEAHSVHSCNTSSTSVSQNHRITESQNSRGWKGPLWVI